MRLPLILAALCGLFLYATQASAQGGTCADRATVAAMLQGERYRENVIGRALGMRQGVQVLVEFWANPETGTWTATYTDPQGMTCLMADGTNHEAEAYVAPVTGDPA